ncbi:HAD family hydrolase [Raoultibacter phocaeensis]|uniref:HAD family hydrolase n=1 Tax=Raoultibacter phocaeensis TaxID=2479841 RepID=UPI001118E30C|nr:HAD-IA family hydrolase [Raoultibacter phocaeensis]
MTDTWIEGGMIKAVLFDVGSTLIDPEPDIDGTFCAVAARRGHVVDPEVVLKHMPSVNGFYEEEYLRDGDFWCSHEGSEQMYLDMYRYLSHLCGLGHDAEAIAREMNEAYRTPANWAVFDDALPCLKELKRRHLRLGIVSNWSSNLEDLIRGLRMAPYFDEIVSSADVGYRKPNPMIFTVMLERLGIDASEAVHVGDRPDADGAGARSAGVHPIIVDRAGIWSDSGYDTIPSLDALADALERVEQRGRIS